MFDFIQSLEAHVFTFKEVAGYVTIAMCMSFAVGFLIAAYTRIFKTSPKGEIKDLGTIEFNDGMDD